MSDQQPKSLPMAPGAMGSLIMGIISLCTCFWVGLIFAIIGMVLGGKAKKAIAANPSGYRAAGLAKAGHTVSIIGLIVTIIVSVVYTAVIIFGAASGISSYMN